MFTFETQKTFLAESMFKCLDELVCIDFEICGRIFFQLKKLKKKLIEFRNRYQINLPKKIFSENAFEKKADSPPT